MRGFGGGYEIVRRLAIGVDIGGTKTAAGVVSDDGLFEPVRFQHTASGGPDQILQAVDGMVDDIRTDGRKRGFEIETIGVASAGIINKAGDVIYASSTIPGWQGVSLIEHLGSRHRVPVAVANDVDAMAFAEARLGVAGGSQNCLVVAVGTGIGGAWVNDGVVQFAGSRSGGELGHLVVGGGGAKCHCGRVGHLESYSSGRAIELLYSGQSRPRKLEEIRDLAQQGDPRASRIIRSAARTLGRALGGLANATGVDSVVVGGGVLQVEPGFFELISSSLRDELMDIPGWKVTVQRDHLGASGPLTGAGMVALDAGRGSFEAFAAYSDRPTNPGPR